MIILSAACFIFSAVCFFSRAHENAYSFAVLGTFFLFITLLNAYNRRSEKRFSLWLCSNAERLRLGTPVDPYKGEEYERFNTLTQFSYCVSFIFFTKTYYSASCRTENRGKCLAMALFYCLVNLAYGLWAVPFGPVFTFKNIVSCLKGGHKYALTDVLESMPKMERFENFDGFIKYQEEKYDKKSN